MPKSDTCQDGNALDTMGEMDSTGSCDSAVSLVSCFSDDSLGFLSAEEKACLMFLEETIQSLDTEDDSGLSNDESDLKPARGNVATKAAHLSASIGLNKLTGQDIPRRHYEGPLTPGSPRKNEIVNYMVPTPFILANCNSQISNRPGLVASHNKKPSNMKMPSGNSQLCHEAPQVPSEVNVVVIPPPHLIKSKTDTVKENLNNQKAQNVSCRGPLSYEGLVQLRKAASVRKNNTSEAKMEEQLVSTNKNVHLFSDGSPPGIQTLPENSKAKTSTGFKPPPPPVAPKPKGQAPHQAPMNQEEATNPRTDSNMPHSGVLTVKKLMNPEKVRLEALSKLGLLKVEPCNSRQLRTQGQNLISQQLRHPQSPVHSQTTGDPLPPCVAPKPGKLINQPVQTNPLRQRSVSELCIDPPRSQHINMTSVGKAATLEFTGTGRSNHGPSGSDITELNAVSQTHQLCSSTVETKDYLRDTQIDASESRLRKGQESGQVSSSHSKSQYVPALSIPVHNIGKDRREALRKLGLLKN